MRVLYVCKYIPNLKDNLSTFNRELILELKEIGVQIDVFLIKGNGFLSYVKFFFLIKKKLHKCNYDIVHSVYVLTAFLSCFQSKVPAVSHFIGSDINIRWERFISKYFVIKRSRKTIFVSNGLYELAGKPQNGVVIPFGIDLKKFFPMDKDYCKGKLKLDLNKKYILFSSRFDRSEKNADLAIKAIEKLDTKNIILKELKNIPENEINLWYNASDVALMTSKNEGSPQFIKEAMACNRPIVSTDVGDVRFAFGETKGCFITSFDADVISGKIMEALEFSQEKGKTTGRQRVVDIGFDANQISKKVYELYQTLL